MSVDDPGCVKTRLSEDCVELFSQLPSSERSCQYNRLPHRRNRDGISTRKLDIGVFTQAGPETDISQRGQSDWPGDACAHVLLRSRPIGFPSCLMQDWLGRESFVLGTSRSDMSQQPTSNGSGPSLMPLIGIFTISRLIYVAAELGLADKMSDGPKSADVLATETGTHAQSLYRMLRALTAFGIFEETEPRKFSLTAMGAQLRSDVPGSVRNFARFFGDHRSWRCYGEIEHSIRTGETAMRRVYGISAFEHLSAHPDEASIFNEAMADVTRRVARVAAAAYDFSAFQVIMDVGGGNGTLIAELLRAAPAARGILFDLPAGVSEAQKVLSSSGVAKRCTIVPGDFFKTVPTADAMVLKSVIHDWDDASAISILRTCRSAASADTRLLLIERVMPERMTVSPTNQRGSVLDIRMLVLPGGRERTEQEYQALLASSGFAWTSTLMLPEPIDMAVIEATPRMP
jgi:O-methyltransferase domain/Dimerisation domain